MSGENQDISQCRICIGAAVLAIGLYITVIFPSLMTLDSTAGSTLLESLKSILYPISSVLVSLLVIAGGGLLSWRVQRNLTAPELELLNSELRQWRPHSLSNKRVLRVQVTNSGTRPVKNCKAQVSMSIEVDSSFWNIDQTLTWSGTDYPNSMMINSGEVDYLNLFLINSSVNELGIPSGEALKEEGVITRQSKIHPDSLPTIYTSLKLSRITRAENKNFNLIISSENCPPIYIRFEIDSDEVVRITDVSKD